MWHEIERFNADVSKNPAVLMAALNGDHGLNNIVSAARGLGYDFDLDDARDYIRDRTRDDDWARTSLGVDPEPADGVYLADGDSDSLGRTIAHTNTVVVTEAAMLAHVVGVAEVAAAAIVIGVVVLLATEPDVVQNQE